MSALNYLTVQDILWINLQITKKVQTFDFADLEEASYYQYAYGQSNSLLAQAGRFASGFLRKKPLSAGNDETAFIALATFLKLNGYELNVTDGEAKEWIKKIASGAVSGLTAVSGSVTESHHHDHGHNPAVKATISEVLQTYPSLVQ